MSLGKCLNFGDFRRLAQRRLPAPFFHYIDGGADDEVALRRNTAAFDDYDLMPRFLVDVSKIDTRTTIFGREIAFPVFCSPTAMSRLFHHESEPAVARAAAKLGTMYALSTMATTRLEDIAAMTSGPKMYQIYVLKNRAFTHEMIARCKAAKYDAICVTVDTPILGSRERDKKSGMVIPPRLGLGEIANFFLHPAWSLNFLLNPNFSVANMVDGPETMDKSGVALIQYINSQIDSSLTWDDLAKLRELWGGPFAVKGLQSADDAKRAREIGATAIMISNHGGRQLDSAPAPFDCIAPMRDAIGNDLEIICDGGIRRGTHVLKALAAGANACSIGRPYLFALAAGGEAGVERALTLLRTEIERDMALMGATKIADIDRSFLRKR
jgi:L-lactate dehydrogenase (cytochrome)